MPEKPIPHQLAIFDKVKRIMPVSISDWLTIATIVIIIFIWIADLFIPDPVPFIDEILIPFVAYYLTQWYANRQNKHKDTKTHDENDVDLLDGN